MTYQYKVGEMKEYYKDLKLESKEHLKNRIQSVIEKYKDYDCVIFVFHQLAIKSVIDVDKVKPAEIILYQK